MVFTSPLPALPGSPPGSALVLTFTMYWALLQTPPAFGFPEWLSRSPHLRTIPHHHSLSWKQNFIHLSLGSLPSSRLQKILGLKSAPTLLSKASLLQGLSVPLLPLPPLTRGTGPLLEVSLSYSVHIMAQRTARPAFPSPCPFPAGLICLVSTV